jgi:hypothetical protein
MMNNNDNILDSLPYLQDFSFSASLPSESAALNALTEEVKEMKVVLLQLVALLNNKGSSNFSSSNSGM